MPKKTFLWVLKRKNVRYSRPTLPKHYQARRYFVLFPRNEGTFGPFLALREAYAASIREVANEVAELLNGL